MYSEVDGCEALSGDKLRGKIALINSLNWSTLIKATHIQNAGAAALLIFNSYNSYKLEKYQNFYD